MALEPHALAAVLLSICALLLFSRNEVPLEQSCITVLIVLVLLFEVFPFHGVADVSAATLLRGFGNEALISICQLVRLLIEVLNDGIRPHLTRWQAKYRHWFAQAMEDPDLLALAPQEMQRRFPEYDELTKDLIEVNQVLIRYRNQLHELITKD